MQAIHPKYKTFWRRFWANIIDGVIIYLPIVLIDYVLFYENTVTGEKSILDYLFSYDRSFTNSDITLTVISALIYIAYSVYLTGVHGGTLGKKIMGITVLNGDEEKSFIGIKRAVIRDLPYIIAEFAAIIYLLVTFSSGSEIALHTDPVMRIIDNLIGIWAIAELVTMLGNERRRAIHDILANSVVVKQVQEEAIPE